MFTSILLCIFWCFTTRMECFHTQGKKGTFSQHNPHIKKKKNEVRKRKKQKYNKKSLFYILHLPFFLFLSSLLCTVGDMSLSGVSQCASDFFSKFWFFHLQKKGSNSSYLLRSPDKIIQQKLLAQGLAQRKDSMILNAHFFTSLA